MALMRGPTALRGIVATYLASNFPAYLTLARTQWNLTAFKLPNPVVYDAYEPFLSDSYPIVGMYIVSDSDHRRVDYSAKMEEEFEVQYACRIFAAVTTPKLADETWEHPPYAATVRCREDMTTALRDCILNQPSFGSPAIQLQEDTINTDYPELLRTKSQGERYIGAGIITVQIKFTESLYREQIGLANTVQILTGSL